MAEGRLAGEVAIVTGSTQGIGAVVAATFAREGASVVVTGRSSENGERVASSIRADGGDALFQRCDLGDEDQIAALVDTAADRFGGVSVLVNNGTMTEDVRAHAGMALADMPTEDWRRMLEVGVTGAVFLTSKHALPHMLARGKGAIVNVSSVVAARASHGMGAYGAYKAALHAVTLSLAVEYGRQGIRANTLMLGRIETADKRAPVSPDHARVVESFTKTVLTPRLGRPSDVAGACTWLCSDEGEFVTGTLIPIDGGFLAHHAGALPLDA
jgi:NAD(P)-dependent dehydrogenase (short-subunit alcohol dehydrogenase family)